MNIAPLKLAIAPVKSKSLWLVGLALLAIGVVSWGTYKVVHNPDRLKPLLAAGVPLQVLEPLPFLGQAIETAECSKYYCYQCYYNVVAGMGLASNDLARIISPYSAAVSCFYSSMLILDGYMYT